MENTEFQFKTNINCSGCVASIEPHLNNAAGICEWDVNIANKVKILTIKSTGITREQVLEIIKNNGFKADALDQ
jgi:copper chaperone